MDIADRIAALDWARIPAELDGFGAATTGPLLTPEECGALAALYPRGRLPQPRGDGPARLRPRRVQYFAYPLPDLVAGLRAALYPRLAPVANRWNEAMGLPRRFPADHAEFLARCHAAGQTRPTPLLLRYGPGDYNCLHQDLYGEHVFPLQVAVLLSRAGPDFTGGEFVLTEQRPRMQSRAEVVPLRQGEAVVFAVHHRPVQGTRGIYASTCGMASAGCASGERHTLGVIFHDAA